jgi:hypothetical protein
MVYGVYESQDAAQEALQEILSQLQQNAPLRIPQHGNRVCSSSRRTGCTTPSVTR